MTETLAKYEAQDMATQIERVVIENDLSALSPEERLTYYKHVCGSLGLNWLTKPFNYIELDDGKGNKKLTLYATRDCTDQLREKHGISITKLDRERMQDLYVVTATARTPDGREDSSIGAVPIARENGDWKKTQSGKSFFQSNGTSTPLSGEALANAFMKAETKAKRRVTLSICGLGMSDETEVDAIPGARIVEPDALPAQAEHNGHAVNTSTGEMTPAKSKRRQALEDGYVMMCQKYGQQFGIPVLNPDWTDEDLQGTGNHWKKVVQDGLAAAKRAEEAEAAGQPIAEEDLPF